MKNKLSTNAHSALEMIIAEECLRQSRYSFNAALAATIFSSIVSAALLLSGKVPEGAVTTSISVGCSKLAKDANDRLDRITKELIDQYSGQFSITNGRMRVSAFSLRSNANGRIRVSASFSKTVRSIDR